MKRRDIYIFIFLLTVSASCRKPYLPPAIVAPNNYLVVEGVVNAGSDSTFIKLSRTVKLSEKVSVKPETGAVLTVEGGSTPRTLQEIRAGVYASAGLNLDISKKYNLRIKTSNGQEYLSDAIQPKITPPIDSVSYVVKPAGIDINISAHDPQNSTRYYRWDYDETWRFHTKYISEFVAKGAVVVPRGRDEQVYYCFANDTSSTVILASTTKLSQDVVANNPLTNVSGESEKLSVRYSINVRQYALTKESFEFWENLKKNTEQLGSVFDALPSQSIGNIHNVKDAAEPVVGFIDICTVTTKRIFIDESALPNYQTKYPYDCSDTTVYYSNKGVDEVASNLLNHIYIPTKGIFSLSGDLIGFRRTEPECADCTLRGVTKQPAFWK